jgi:hypothetical protein
MRLFIQKSASRLASHTFDLPQLNSTLRSPPPWIKASKSQIMKPSAPPSHPNQSNPSMSPSGATTRTPSDISEFMNHWSLNDTRHWYMPALMSQQQHNFLSPLGAATPLDACSQRELLYRILVEVQNLIDDDFADDLSLRASSSRARHGTTRPRDDPPEGPNRSED